MLSSVVQLISQFSVTSYATTFVLCCLTFVLLWIWYPIKKRNLPPLVKGLPFFGYLPLLEEKIFLTLDKLGRRTGGVFRLKLGVKEVLVITDFQAFQEAYQKKVFLGRPQTNTFQGKHVLGFVDMSGEKWKEQRQFTIRTLHKMGYGTTKMEHHLKFEAQELVDILGSKEGHPCRARSFIQSSVGNNISIFVYGKELPSNDKKRVDIETATSYLTSNVRQINLRLFLPWLAKLKPNNSTKQLDSREKLENIFINDVVEHEISLDVENPQGYVDEYLLEMQKFGEDKMSSFTRDRLIGNIRLMFTAGVQTVTTTMEWCLVAMVAYPHVQTRVQQEIDQIIGRYGEPFWGHRSQLPYVGAVLMEVQRWRTVFPLNLFRRTTEDASIQGFEVPKDTTVISNLWSIHNDPKIWKDPSEFRPERFLSNDGTEILKNDAFVAFSYGKRSCPGELLAQMELYFYFVYIMKNFTVSSPTGKEVDQDGTLMVSFLPNMEEFLFRVR